VESSVQSGVYAFLLYISIVLLNHKPEKQYKKPAIKGVSNMV